MPDEETAAQEAVAADEGQDNSQDSQAIAEATESSNANANQSQEARQRNANEYNWAEARRKMQELERRAKEQEEQLAQMRHKSAPQTQEVDDELDKLADDDIITKKQAMKLAGKMARQIAAESIRMREASTVEERLSNKFPDFANVVTKENIDLLKQQEPELAKSLGHNPDPYEQGVAAYKTLKKLGIYQEETPMKNSKEMEKAKTNSAKPVSVNAATKSSALSNAHMFENGLTPELKKTLWKEMQDAAKRY